MSQRRDAIRNRGLLVEAGREVFAEQGADASLEEVARRAGVGIGTLYRHFPTRDALVEEIFAEHIGEVLAAAEEAAANEDAWAGVVSFFERVLELQARNLQLRDVFLRYSSGDGTSAERRKQVRAALGRLVARGREQGTLRADFALSDLLVAWWSFAPVLQATCAVAPDAWRRQLRIVLDGMRAGAATPQTARPLTGPQLDAAIDALRSRYHRKRAAA
jgi:AcrR family transcriptional regulator